VEHLSLCVALLTGIALVSLDLSSMQYPIVGFRRLGVCFQECKTWTIYLGGGGVEIEMFPGIGYGWRFGNLGIPRARTVLFFF